MKKIFFIISLLIVSLSAYESKDYTKHVECVEGYKFLIVTSNNYKKDISVVQIFGQAYGTLEPISCKEYKGKRKMRTLKR